MHLNVPTVILAVLLSLSAVKAVGFDPEVSQFRRVSKRINDLINEEKADLENRLLELEALHWDLKNAETETSRLSALMDFAKGRPDTGAKLAAEYNRAIHFSQSTRAWAEAQKNPPYDTRLGYYQAMNSRLAKARMEQPEQGKCLHNEVFQKDWY